MTNRPRVALTAEQIAETFRALGLESEEARQRFAELRKSFEPITGPAYRVITSDRSECEPDGGGAPPSDPAADPDAAVSAHAAAYPSSRAGGRITPKPHAMMLVRTVLEPSSSPFRPTPGRRPATLPAPARPRNPRPSMSACPATPCAPNMNARPTTPARSKPYAGPAPEPAAQKNRRPSRSCALPVRNSRRPLRRANPL